MVSRRDPLDGCSLFSACVAPRSPRGRSSMSPSPVLSPLKRCQVSPKTKDQKHCNTGSIQRVGGPGRSRDTAHPSFLPSSFLSSFIHSLCYCLFLFLSLPFLPSYFFYFFFFFTVPWAVLSHSLGGEDRPCSSGGYPGFTKSCCQGEVPLGVDETQSTAFAITQLLTFSSWGV